MVASAAAAVAATTTTTRQMRVPEQWLPFVVAAAACAMGAVVLVAVYAPTPSLRRRRPATGAAAAASSAAQRARRLLDIDLSAAHTDPVAALMRPKSTLPSDAGAATGAAAHPGAEATAPGTQENGSNTDMLPEVTISAVNSHHLITASHNSRGLDQALVGEIIVSLIERAPLELHQDSAFSGAVAGLSGRPAYGGRKPGLAIREETDLPPFHQQTDHLMREIRAAKRRGKPLLVEGPPGIGKATALQQWVADEGRDRPAIYLQLSQVLRKRHGGSSIEDDDDDASPEDSNFYTETETETEGLEERVTLTVKRDAFKRAVAAALGADRSHMEASMISMDDADADEDDEDAASAVVDMSLFNHIAQALRLIASKSKHGPTMIVIDDIQLLFRERTPLVQKYDAIPEIFQWLLKCDLEGTLDVVLCCSEKSAVGAIKRLKGFDWGLTLHSVDGVDDDVIIDYLLNDVNSRIQDRGRRFTKDTAALFVATFNGSLLELDSYFRDVNSNVFMFIKKRERSFLRHLQRHIPQRPQRNKPVVSDNRQPYHRGGHKPLGPSSEDELRELFLDIIMRGGVLPVSQLDVNRMSLAEALVERNILRWRDGRIRRRESRPSMRAGWTPPSPQRSSPYGSAVWDSRGSNEEFGGSGVSSPGSPSSSSSATAYAGENAPFPPPLPGLQASGISGAKPTSPTGVTASSSSSIPPAGSSNTTSRVFGLSRPDQWLGNVFGGGHHSKDKDLTSNTRNRSKSPATSTLPQPQQQVTATSAALDPAPASTSSSSSMITDHSGSSEWATVDQQPQQQIQLPVIEDQWASATPEDGGLSMSVVSDLDAAEQLALFAREGAELVWSNNLVRTVCEAFVGGSGLVW